MIVLLAERILDVLCVVFFFLNSVNVGSAAGSVFVPHCCLLVGKKMMFRFEVMGGKKQQSCIIGPDKNTG